jgi:hypothetical protein
MFKLLEALGGPGTLSRKGSWSPKALLCGGFRSFKIVDTNFSICNNFLDTKKKGAKMKRNVLLTILLVCAALTFTVCGGDSKKTETAQPGNETIVPQKDATSQLAPDNEGVMIAKEILGTFDKAVAEVAEIVKDKPEAAALKPKLEALYKTYETKMTEINGRYKALKNKDIRLFGACNGYIGENRGKHVFKKDQTLSEYVAYYNLQKGDMETVKLISGGVVNMLDVAVLQ